MGFIKKTLKMFAILYVSALLEMWLARSVKVMHDLPGMICKKRSKTRLTRSCMIFLICVHYYFCQLVSRAKTGKPLDLARLLTFQLGPNPLPTPA